MTDERESGPTLSIKTTLHDMSLLKGLRQELASGELPDETKYDISQLLKTNGLMIDINGKRPVVISLHSIMDSIIENLNDIPDETKNKHL